MKNFICLLVVAVLLWSCGDQSGYTIHGTVENADGKKVLLQTIQDSNPKTVDSTIVKKGRFTFKGNVKCPEFYLLNVDNNGPIYFFIENSNIDIHFDIDSIAGSVVKGSKENDLFVSFNKEMEKFSERLKIYTDEYMSIELSGNVDPEKVTSLRSEVNKVEEERKNYTIDFVSKNDTNVIAAFLINNLLISQMSIDEIDAASKKFGKSTVESQWVKMLNETVTNIKRSEEGNKFIDLTMSTPEGQSVSIADYAGKGKYVLLDFWASWCRPCRMTNPYMVKLYNKYKNKDFEIIGVSLDREKDKWIKAIGDDNLTWPQMSDLKYWESAAVKAYSISGIPYTVLLDKEGNIIAKGLDVNGLDEKLTKLLE